jgi:peptide/nickel transport system permease protein
MLLGENATPEALAAVRDRLGLNDPIWLQYWHWLTAALTGDFGHSMRTGQPVAPMMLTALSRSLLLALLSILLMLAVAVPLGLMGGAAAGQGGGSRHRLHLLYRRLAAGIRHRDAAC